MHRKAFPKAACNVLDRICQGMTGYMFFFKRHNLKKRITDNVKAVRGEANHEIISSYFDNLEQWLKYVPCSNIYN